MASLASNSFFLALNWACLVLMYCSLKVIRANSSRTPSHLASNLSTDSWRSMVGSSLTAAVGKEEDEEETWSVEAAAVAEAEFSGNQEKKFLPLVHQARMLSRISTVKKTRLHLRYPITKKLGSLMLQFYLNVGTNYCNIGYWAFGNWVRVPTSKMCIGSSKKLEKVDFHKALWSPIFESLFR